MSDSKNSAEQPTVTTGRFAGLKLSGLKAVVQQKNEKRLLSDIEILSNEQYQYLENHTQQQFYSFVQTYWAKKMLAADLTAKTFKGEVITFNWSQIKVVDKRYKGGSHCICGKAIRYEYWLNNYGPIGSVHVCEHTSLDGQLIKDLVKGYKDKNELRTEIVQILAELKDEGKTFDDWLSTFNFEQYRNALNFLSPENRKVVNDLIQLRLPLSKYYRDALGLAQRAYNRSLAMKSYETAPAPTSLSVPQQPSPKDLLIQQIDKLGVYRDFLVANHQYEYKALVSLSLALKNGGSTAQYKYADSLYKKLLQAVETRTAADTPSAANIQTLSRRVLSEIINKHPAENFAKNLYTQSLTRDLTIRQIECIFGRQTGLNKVEPLAKKYAYKLTPGEQAMVDSSLKI